jgi:hypothetical protein
MDGDSGSAWEGKAGVDGGNARGKSFVLEGGRDKVVNWIGSFRIYSQVAQEQRSVITREKMVLSYSLNAF